MYVDVSLSQNTVSYRSVLESKAATTKPNELANLIWTKSKEALIDLNLEWKHSISTSPSQDVVETTMPLPVGKCGDGVPHIYSPTKLLFAAITFCGPQPRH